nr:MAG TPA: minor tail protein Z [Caudoviricetes sp.]
MLEETMSTLKDLSRQLKQLQKQIPFATAQAMTSVVRDIAAAQKVALGRKLESPTPFTVNAVGSSGARKNNLRAKVFVRDVAAEYLEPFEFGGDHKLNSQALLNPKNIKLNKYGNMPRNKLSQLKAKPNVFVGEVNGVDAVWQRRKPKKAKKKRARRSANGTRRPKRKQRAPKLLVRFGDALPVTPTLDYMNRSRSMAAGLMPGALSRAIEDAIRTAK